MSLCNPAYGLLKRNNGCVMPSILPAFVFITKSTTTEAANPAYLWRNCDCTNSAIPATVSTLPDGRVRLDFINPRPDEIAVLVTARRR